MFWIYYPELNQIITSLGGESYNYLTKIIRIKKGEKIVLFDGKGKTQDSEIIFIDKKQIELKGNKIDFTPAPEIKLNVLISITKKDTMDLIINQLVQLGVDYVWPVITEHSIAIKQPLKDNIYKRWQKIVIEACRQSKKKWLTEIKQPQKINSIFSDIALKNDVLKLISWEEAEFSFKDIIKKNKKSYKNYYIIFGPEGSFVKNEIDLLLDNGFIPFSMGKQILRVETAVIAGVTLMKYEFDL